MGRWRGANARRLLVLPTLVHQCRPAQADAPADTITAPRDPMVAATVHFYGFRPFSANITQFDNRSVEDLTGTFDRVYNAFTSKGVPVIMGEYSLFGIAPNYPGIIERTEPLHRSTPTPADGDVIIDLTAVSRPARSREGRHE
jgi:endoglucanase